MEMDQTYGTEMEDSLYGNDVSSLLGHLVCLLGSEVENVFIDDVHTILDDQDAIVGNISLFDHLAKMYVSLLVKHTSFSNSCLTSIY